MTIYMVIIAVWSFKIKIWIEKCKNEQTSTEGLLLLLVPSACYPVETMQALWAYCLPKKSFLWKGGHSRNPSPRFSCPPSAGLCVGLPWLLLPSTFFSVLPLPLLLLSLSIPIEWLCGQAELEFTHLSSPCSLLPLIFHSSLSFIYLFLSNFLFSYWV